MHNFTKLDAVLNFIPSKIRADEDDMQWKRWANQGLDFMKISKKYGNNIAVVPIVNHTAKLPDSLIWINFLTWSCENPAPEEMVDFLCESNSCCSCSKQISCCNEPGIYWADDNAYCGSCDGCVTEPESFWQRTNNICRHTVNFQLWLDSNINKKFKPLKYVGQTSNLSKHFICRGCPNVFDSCTETFSTNPTSKSVTLSMKEGWLCINYQEKLKDEDGNILVENDSPLLQGLAYYGMAQHWLNKDATHEQGAFQRYEAFLFKAQTLLKKYKGSSILQNIELQALDSVIGTTTLAQQYLRWRI